MKTGSLSLVALAIPGVSVFCLSSTSHNFHTGRDIRRARASARTSLWMGKTRPVADASEKAETLPSKDSFASSIKSSLVSGLGKLSIGDKEPYFIGAIFAFAAARSALMRREEKILDDERTPTPAKQEDSHGNTNSLSKTPVSKMQVISCHYLYIYICLSSNFPALPFACERYLSLHQWPQLPHHLSFLSSI